MDLDLTLTAESQEKWLQLKNKEIRYVILKTDSEQKEVQLDSFGERDATFEDFKNAMPKDEPRWALYEAYIEREDGSTANKIIMVHYSPDDYFGSLKFFFATAKQKVETFFVGLNKTWQVSKCPHTFR